MKLSVIVPVYNEKDFIGEIIKQIEQVEIYKEIIVVDDCSIDGTDEYLKRLSDKNNIKIIYHDWNQGKGACIRTALKYAKGDYVIIQDADLEYNPEEYNKLLDTAYKNKALVVYGSRFLKGSFKKFSPLQYLANRILTFFTNFLYGAHLTDIETCYKLFYRDIISKFVIESNRFDIEVELTSKVLKNKIKIIEVPIEYRGRRYREGKKIKAKDGIISFIKLFLYRLK
ncbi:MAG: glycosyltransferase family 2 protein [Candidatus Omnitrophica bacterium]|nr:glycosyltransferase family 2 protein [Candidatus Omnitrophota bacterium]